jgi:hypothetical protein
MAVKYRGEGSVVLWHEATTTTPRDLELLDAAVERNRRDLQAAEAAAAAFEAEFRADTTIN